jgi:hypothetical protein
MADFPRFEYSMHDVKHAGNALRGEILWDESRRDELLEIFTIANSWIDGHAFPMFRIKHEALGKVKSCKLSGLTFARLKRMRSVRKKLSALPTLKLDQIQDLGGCRVILASIDDANKLIDCFRQKGKHALHNQGDYIEQPKRGGYRSHHMIYKFQGEGEAEVFNNRRIEIQIRTRLQHTWATAVEAVGTFRQEDMKAGKGNPDWLRLFELMSAEFALAERCPEPQEVPGHEDRVREIRDLDRKLNAVETLESMRHAVRFTSTYIQGAYAPEFYRIEFNRKKNEVRVSPHLAAREGLREQHSVEQSSLIAGDGAINTVFVSASGIEDLKQGYPNYFGDVQLFNTNLKHVVEGDAAKEYTMPPQEAVPAPPHEAPNMSWFRPGAGRRWR